LGPFAAFILALEFDFVYIEAGDAECLSTKFESYFLVDCLL
jgi:hypothetical protein